MMFNFGKPKQAKEIKPTGKSTGKPTKGGKGAKSVAPVKKMAASGFAAGLVGSDVEAPEFDPLQLSVGRSEETLSWYRAAELKVH